jgi:hypothetical protein
MQGQGVIDPVINNPVFEPTYFNIEYLFAKILAVIKPIIAFLTNPHTWSVLGVISSLLSLFFIAVIIFSLVRMREIQIHEKHEIDHEIHEALERDRQAEKNENPRWHYIQTILESSNDSDWRVSIIEADTMLEDILREKGFTGESVSDLLESARSAGYQNIQTVWDAHIIRNKIAHEGSDFPLTQMEARRTIRMYEVFFQELGVI